MTAKEKIERSFELGQLLEIARTQRDYKVQLYSRVDCTSSAPSPPDLWFARIERAIAAELQSILENEE